MSETRRYQFFIKGMTVELINPPRALGMRRHLLKSTAEAWEQFARNTYGQNVFDFRVTWDEHGAISHRVGRTPINKVKNAPEPKDATPDQVKEAIQEAPKLIGADWDDQEDSPDTGTEQDEATEATPEAAAPGRRGRPKKKEEDHV